MSESWKNGSTRAWRKVRARVLARDGWECRLQLPGVCVGRAMHVHHVVGRAVSGDDESYLEAACGPCNLAVGDPTRRDPPPRPVTRW